MQKQVLPRTLAPVHYVVWESMPGGMESYVSHYADRFYGQREMHLFSLRPAGNGLHKHLDGHFEKGSNNNWACYSRFFRYARRHRGDLFHLLNSGPIILLLLLLAGVRNPVYHIHGTKYWKTWKDKLYLMTAWRIASLFRMRLVANSGYSADIFERDVLPVRPKVVYNGFDLSRFLEKRWLRSRLRKIGYVGRLEHGKNVHLVIRLFEEIAGADPHLELHLAGIGRLDAELRQQAARSPFTDRIHFHGWQADIAVFYQSMDLFLFLSAYESFGNVLPEALLTGLPILTSDIPVFTEIHGGERAFCLGNPENYDEIRQNFLTAIADYPALAQRAYNAAERLKGLFDIETHLKEIELTYETA